MQITSLRMAFVASVLVFMLSGPQAVRALDVPVAEKRQIVSLDGNWQVGEGSLKAPPTSFGHTVPVPGLVDMAQPAFVKVGEEDQPREAFWYRRTFTIPGKVPEVAILKINRAIYGVRVLLNGSEVGSAVTGFSGCECPVTQAIKGNGAENELLVCVGAYRTAIPAAYPDGYDGEKKYYIPGIFDSVSLILSGYPYINNVQVVPEIYQNQIRVVAEIQQAQPAGSMLKAIVREAKTGAIVAEQDVKTPVGGDTKADFTMALPHAHLWTPEDPFLYRFELASEGDSYQTRFGMREFHFDPVKNVPMLNGKPYYLRGSNVTIFRFLEDSQHGQLPWNKDWVEKLHKTFKGMGWNVLRYCIGFPPEFWYDIADENGILIQDEYPIWYNPASPKGKATGTPLMVDAVADEYKIWMRERWNHPCVFLWDGQNESRFLSVTGDAIQKVRDLDLSGRPWDNGWGKRQAPTDSLETHIYLYEDYLKHNFHLSKLQGRDGNPVTSLAPASKKPVTNVVLNEYDWLWLNRDGTPTIITRDAYNSGKMEFPTATTEERRYAYARIMAALTEYWRCHRKAAAVMEFCALGYSRPDGKTSDNLIDVPNIKYEPNFAHAMTDAFNPVGLMVDYWLPNASAGKLKTDVYAINDRSGTWEGPVTLALLKDGKIVSQQKQDTHILSAGQSILKMEVTIPTEPGHYQLMGSLSDHGKRIESIRDLDVAKTN